VEGATSEEEGFWDAKARWEGGSEWSESASESIVMAVDMNLFSKSVLWDKLRTKRTFRTLLLHCFPFSLRFPCGCTSF
jgi:hypothetical protein